MKVKASHCVSRLQKMQKGEALMESLIAMLLMSIIGLGLAYAMSRTLNAQRYASTQALVVTQMRQALLTSGVPGLCSAGTVTIDGQASSVTCAASASVSVSTSGITKTVPTITTLSSIATPSSVATQERYGGDGVIRISQ